MENNRVDTKLHDDQVLLQSAGACAPPKISRHSRHNAFSCLADVAGYGARRRRAASYFLVAAPPRDRPRQFTDYLTPPRHACASAPRHDIDAAILAI